MICKHNFKPRYSKKWSTALKDMIDAHAVIENAKGDALTTSYLQTETYIYDICIKCGMIVRDPNV